MEGVEVDALVMCISSLRLNYRARSDADEFGRGRAVGWFAVGFTVGAGFVVGAAFDVDSSALSSLLAWPAAWAWLGRGFVGRRGCIKGAAQLGF